MKSGPSAPGVAPPSHDPDVPARFAQALLSLREVPAPRGLEVKEVPAPRRLAPYAAALSVATTEDDGAAPLASGRLVILHDPAGQKAWDGDFRLVVQATARLDDEVGTDPALAQAAWSWLTDSLEHAGAGYHALVGTVTRVLSDTFGGLELRDACAHAEVRASWTPTTCDLSPHLAAWYELVHVAAGHEPETATPLRVTPTHPSLTATVPPSTPLHRA